MKTQLRFLLLVLFFTHRLDVAQTPQLYIWNVGQGQWLTWISNNECIHFDMGGEWAPKRKVKQLCANKANSLFVSHSDQDHIEFIPWGKKNLMGLCVFQLPKEKLSKKKAKLFASLMRCHKSQSRIREVPMSAKFSTINEMSRVYILDGMSRSVIIPGDSTIKAEKIWAAQIQSKKMKVLILGHHGSRTSTSDMLLKSQPGLNQAFCSSRKKRYGHPHPNIKRRLNNYGIPLLPTEIWGNIRLEI